MSRNCAPHHSRSRDPTRQCTSPSITKFLRTPYLRTALGNYRATPKAELQAVSGYRLRMSDAMRKSGLSISAPSILQTLPRHCKTCLHMSTGRERDKERERESQRERERERQDSPRTSQAGQADALGSPQKLFSGATAKGQHQPERQQEAQDWECERCESFRFTLALGLGLGLASPKS